MLVLPEGKPSKIAFHLIILLRIPTLHKIFLLQDQSADIPVVPPADFPLAGAA
jgi:hypothetical protein